MSVLSQDAWKYAEGDPRRDLFPAEWDNELPPKEWLSLKKTNVDLNALRSQGYKITLWHGESDTLYKLKPQGGEKGNPKNITGN